MDVVVSKSAGMDRITKNVLTAVTVILIFVDSAGAEKSKDKSDFRNVRWGMTRLEVMASEERAPELFGLSSIIYNPEVQGRDFHLIYEFVENRLSDAKFRFVAYNLNDYLWLKKLVAIKYGPPIQSHDSGYGNFEYKWKDADTEIVLKPGNKREFLIHYVGLKYKYLKTSRDKKITMKNEENAKKTF